VEIDINQRIISIGDKYDIFINRKQAYAASAKLFRLLTEIHLFEFSDNRLKYIIKKKWPFFNVAFDLTNQNNRVFQFRTEKYWKGHYYCQVGQDLYEIFAHKGRKYSVYKNNTQIAWWDKEAIAWFNGDNYKIIADKDSDYELIISFCLIIDCTFYKSNNESTIKINYGKVTTEAKKFDPTWKPKH